MEFGKALPFYFQRRLAQDFFSDGDNLAEFLPVFQAYHYIEFHFEQRFISELLVGRSAQSNCADMVQARVFPVGHIRESINLFREMRKRNLELFLFRFIGRHILRSVQMKPRAEMGRGMNVGSGLVSVQDLMTFQDIPQVRQAYRFEAGNVRSDLLGAFPDQASVFFQTLFRLLAIFRRLIIIRHGHSP